ncbi:hypothetical protein GF366_01475 [Candidatus Peregrinibacteria bacterium]|nr:hypothetical protein [Candidatus Peregrinibacteria bacterium]
MKLKNLLIAAILVGTLSLLYNVFVFKVFDFYPDLSSELKFLENIGFNFYLIVFIKNFIVGFILMFLFSLAYRNIVNDTGEWIYTAKGVVFFVLYALFAYVSFSLGDIFLMKTTEGMFIVLTIDGLIETIIATIPIRIYSQKA